MAKNKDINISPSKGISIVIKNDIQQPLPPKPNNKQRKEKTATIRSGNLTEHNSKLQSRNISRGYQCNSGVKPFLSDTIRYIHRQDAHNHEGELYNKRSRIY